MITIMCKCNNNSNEATEDNVKTTEATDNSKEFTRIINESHSNVYFNRRYTNTLLRKYGGTSERIRLCIHRFTENIYHNLIQFFFVLACILIMALPVSLIFCML
mgnify:CR=1 FL=1